MIVYHNTDPLPPLKRDSWLRRTSREIAARVKEKFKLGEAQYKSDFGTQTMEYLLDQIEQEAIDTLMYVREAKRRQASRQSAHYQTFMIPDHGNVQPPKPTAN